MPFRPLPLLIVAGGIAAGLPAQPVLVAEAPVTATIERDGVTLQFRHSTLADASWPVPLADPADRSAARFDLNRDGRDELIVAVRTAGSKHESAGAALLVRYVDGTVERIVDAVHPEFGREVSVADVNGDGFGDLVADGDGLWVFPGGPGGLNPAATQRLSAATPGLPAGARLDGQQAVGDLSGDGFADLAVGVESATVGAASRAGAVTVLFGGAAGLTAAGSQVFTQDTAGVPDAVRAQDGFGSAVAIGDVTGDGRQDLVVGARADGTDYAGSVTVLPGTVHGPTGTSATRVSAGQLDHLGLSVTGLGADLVVAEVTGDGRADVVSSAPDSVVFGGSARGSVFVLPGSPAGIAARAARAWHPGTPGVAGPLIRYARFGHALSSGDVTGDGRPDLLVGTPFAGSGAVTVLPNSAAGLTGVGSAYLTGGSGDLFGARIQALEATGTGPREVVVGALGGVVLYAAVNGALQPVGPLRPGSTFGADDLTIYPWSVGVLPNGVPLPAPAAGVANPAPAVSVVVPRSRFDIDGDGRDEVVVGDSYGAYLRYSGSGRVDPLAPRFGRSGATLSFAAGSFNGDRYVDLAVGDPDDPEQPSANAQGSVWVCYGTPDGLDLDRCQKLSQDSPGVPGGSANGDRFGAAVAAGDLNGDGRADLAVGAPGDRVGKASDAGSVTVFYGSATGLRTTGGQLLQQNLALVPGVAEGEDQFGSALAIGDVTGDRRGDLVVASLGEDRVGSVTVLKGAAGGLAASGATAVGYRQLKPGSDNGADFGAALAVADLNRDGRAEVVVGAPAAAAGRRAGAGVVVVLTGSPRGVAKTAFRVVHQDSAGVPNVAESGDRFGAALATGDVTGDGFTDVLVGVPDEGIGTVASAGAVTVLPGDRSGVTGAGSAWIVQGAGGVPGRPERFDNFGSAVSVLNLDGSEALDALVGSWQEHISNPSNLPGEGSVTEFTARAGGLVGTGAWNPATVYERYGLLEAQYLGQSALAQ